MRYEATYTANAVSVRVVTYGMGWADIFSICMVEESNARVNLGGCSFTYSEPDVFFYLGFLHIRYSLPLFRVERAQKQSVKPLNDAQMSVGATPTARSKTPAVSLDLSEYR